jgi:hypothetical protein
MTPRGVTIEIGGRPIRIDTRHRGFEQILRARYANFLTEACPDSIGLEVEIVDAPSEANAEADLSVRCHAGLWIIGRGDFHATYDARSRRGFVRQTANPWSIDTLIRIVHSLELAGSGGFLIHAASAIRNGRGLVFAGKSGAGKTTISRLAPVSARLLSDEISYLRMSSDRFLAWGTPFAGDLGVPGPNVSAPVAALYFLEHGARNRIERLCPADALRSLMKHILFFAEDPESIGAIFDTAAEFLEKTAVFRLAFTPDIHVWSMIE